MPLTPSAGSCLLCGGSNACALASSATDSPCWCTQMLFPAELLASVPLDARGKACICRRCVVASAAVRPAVSSNPSWSGRWAAWLERRVIHTMDDALHSSR